MRTLTYPTVARQPAFSRDERREKLLVSLKRTLWLYVILIFLEGPLRKWLLSAASDILIIARDPVVVLALFYALRLGAFKGNRFVFWTGILGLVCVLASLAVGANPLVVLYGWRCDFLHVPIAALIIQTFNRRDLEALAKWLLLLSLPNGLLMFVQFHSPPASWINSGTDNTFGQIGLGQDIIRPPGIFTFATGPSEYYPIVFALILAPVVRNDRQELLLRIAALIGVGAAVIFSGSRILWTALIIVLAVYIISTARFRPADFIRRLPAITGIGVILPTILAIPSVAAALAVFYESRLGGTHSDKQTADFLVRIGGLIAEPIAVGYGLPFLGYGLGFGTIIGWRLTGVFAERFADVETEWTRNVAESGLILGGFFIFARLYVVAYLFSRGIQAARRKDLSVLLLWAATAPLVFNANIGQTTTLGMMIFGAGLTGLAAKVSLDDRSLASERPQ